MNALLCEELHVPPHYDLLAIDIDGQDYYLWEALHCARARVVVIEFNDERGPEHKERHDPGSRWTTGAYGSGSRTLLRLAEQKQYGVLAYFPTKLVFVDLEAAETLQRLAGK